MSALWPLARLESLTTKVGSGSTPRGGAETYKTSGIPLIRSMNVVFFGFKRNGLAYLDDKQAAALQNSEVRGGDVLLNITGASIGRVTLAPQDLDGARVNQHVCIIRPAQALDARYLSAFLSTPAIQEAIGAENYGVTRQALTKQQILDFKIPLAPLKEQQRIADKLDALLERVDACREKLDCVLLILNRLRQAVLAAATSGMLTEDWREQAATWPSVSLGDLLRDIRYGTSKKCSYDLKHGIGVVRIPNLVNGKISTADLKYGLFDQKEIDNLSLREGDILMIRSNGSVDLVGKSALVGPESAGYLHAGYLLRLRVKESLLSCDYLNHLLSSPNVRNQIELRAKSTSGVNNINAEEIRTITVRLPPLKEQQEIVHRIDKLFALADRLERRYLTAHQQIKRLTPSLLAKAFRGELVEQDPNDEPAADKG